MQAPVVEIEEDGEIWNRKKTVFSPSEPPGFTDECVKEFPKYILPSFHSIFSNSVSVHFHFVQLFLAALLNQGQAWGVIIIPLHCVLFEPCCSQSEIIQ